MTKKRGRYSREAYRKIKEYILNNDFYPGQHIRHIDVSDALRMGRTPAREAMQRLVEEGLVRHLPNRGYFVSEITPVEATELYELREILEAFCVDRALKRLTKKEMGELKLLLEEYERTLDGHVSRRTLLADRNIHLKLAAAAGNQLVYRILAGVFDKIIMKRNFEGIRASTGRDSIKRHAAILQAIEAGDRVEALRELRGHIREGKQHALEQIDGRKAYRIPATITQ